MKSPLSTPRASILALFGFAALAQGTPTGLNNIPTSDSIPHRTVAVQVFDSFGPGEHDFWTGFKTGWELPWANLEWGLDSHLAPNQASPLDASFMLKLNYVFTF